jgi:multicomponent Na+:H+ antiporter subunit D
MSDQLPAILLLSPLMGALMVGLAGPGDPRRCFPITFASLAVSLAGAIALLVRVAASGPVDYFVGGWAEPLGIGIQLRIDGINALLLVAITTVAVLVSVYSTRPGGGESAEKTPQAHMLFLLCCVGLLGITITGDAFNVFVLVEVASLSSYALVAMGSKPRGTVAAFNYIIMGTIGASFYLLGVGYLYMRTGTLNMAQIHGLMALPEIAGSKTIPIAFLLILVGVWIKMAFFPLYGWLPNAYSYCPATSSCILAPLMTKVSVYVMIRIMLSVFGTGWVFQSAGWSHAVVWLAVLAILAGSFLALAQVELKKMLCYLIVAEVGYMVGGAWLANEWGMVGAIYHILADAFMTLCLFLAANTFVTHCGSDRIDQLEGLFKKMPLVTAGFVVGALGMIGVPPTCGFFSKWFLIRGGIEAGQWQYVIALLISSLVNAVLFFRIFEIAYFGRKPADGHHHHDDGHEPIQQGLVCDRTGSDRRPGFAVAAPVLIAASLVVLLGVFNGPIVEIIRGALEGMPFVSPAPAVVSR